MNIAAKRTMTVIGASLLSVLLGTTASVEGASSDTCMSGFVWREAFPGDHVCVTPGIRGRAAADNQAALLRREPRGGAYGPDTCRQGFVWREARPSDHVCVTPETRTQTASDNRAAASRVARPPTLAQVPRPNPVTRPDARVSREPPVKNLPPSGFQFPPPRPAPGATAKRGFDENGEPYIDETLSDGSTRRQQRRGVTVIKPDGMSEFFPPNVMASEAPPPTPPALPSDPTLGRAWVDYHNRALFGLIALLVRHDQTELQKFNAAEARTAGTDVFEQVEYRTRILTFLAQP